MSVVDLDAGLREPTTWMALALIVLVGAYAIAAAKQRWVTVSLRLPIAIAVVVPSAIALWKLFTDSTLALDQLIWHTRALQVMEHLQGTLRGEVSDFSGKDGYVWILGGIYSVTGPAPMVPVVINIVLWALIIVLVAALAEFVIAAESTVPQESARRGVLIGTMLLSTAPAVVFWVPSVLREAVSSFLIVTVLFATARLLQRRRLRYIVVIAASLWVLFWIRDSIGLGVTMAIVLGFVLAAVAKSRLRGAIRLLIAVVAVGVAVPGWSLLSSRFGLSSEEVVEHSVNLGEGSSTGFISASHSGSGALGVLTTAIPRVLVGPFPWEWVVSGGMILAIVGLASWLMILVPAVSTLWGRKGFDRAGSRGCSTAIWIVALALLAMIAISVGNYGILTRFRAMPLVALVPIASLAYALSHARAQQRRVLSAMTRKDHQHA